MAYISPTAISAGSDAYDRTYAGTNDYLASAERSMERDFNIASLPLGLGSRMLQGFRMVSALYREAEAVNSVTRTTEIAVAHTVDYAGAGGNWPVLNEVHNPSVVQQITKTSCGQACAQMMLADRGVVVDQSVLGSEATSAQGLAGKMNTFDSGWKGAGVDNSSFGALNKTGSWSAFMLDRGSPLGHWIVVDGLDKGGLVMLRDPWKQTSYRMLHAEFQDAWTGFSVFKP